MRFITLLLAFIVFFPSTSNAAESKWVPAWATSQMIAIDKNALTPDDLTDATLRQIVRLNQGGQRYRLRLSNLFGTEPLKFDSVYLAHAARLGTSQIDANSDVAVTFGGKAEVVVPAGAELLSDPISFETNDLSDVAITVHVPVAPAVQTSHPGSRTNSYLVHGDHAADAELVEPMVFAHWFFITSLEVEAPESAQAIVIFGDSITDGFGVTPDTNTRWPDTLARRLAGKNRPVLNSGIGGNRLLLDGLGPNALARFDREVLSQPGVGYVIVLEGVNDLGMLTRDAPATREAHAELVAAMVNAYAQMIERAHAHGIKIYGATIMPFNNEYYHPPAETEADRLAVNAWIRSHFDAVIDFDALLRDPADPGRLNPIYDSGDHLHPSIDGYRFMGEQIPLEWFNTGH